MGVLYLSPIFKVSKQGFTKIFHMKNAPRQQTWLYVFLLLTTSAYCRPNTLDQDRRILSEASSFSLGFTGVGGVQNPAQGAFIRLVEQKTPSSSFVDIYKNGSTPAKIYVLCWASTFDKHVFNNLKNEIEPSTLNSTVTTIRGSIMSQQKVADLLAGMDAGDCGTVLMGGVK